MMGVMDEEREPLEKLWQDSDHWSGGIYFCKEDPRLVVRKRLKWTGWTINFGHKWSTASLVALIMFPVLVVIAILLGVILRAA